MPQSALNITAARALKYYNITEGLLPVIAVNATASIFTTSAKNTAAGSLSATNTPTSWTIVNGNEAGYFAIDNSGNVTVNVDSGLTVGTYVLNIAARNATGAGNATDTIYISSASNKEPGTKLSVMAGATPTAALTTN